MVIAGLMSMLVPFVMSIVFCFYSLIILLVMTHISLLCILCKLLLDATHCDFVVVVAQLDFVVML